MSRNRMTVQTVAGFLLVIAALVVFLATDMTVPVPIALAIAGIALIGTSMTRRKR